MKPGLQPIAAQPVANLFLQVIVPQMKTLAGANWVAELKARFPLPPAPRNAPFGIGTGLNEESINQICRLPAEAADYFDALMWSVWQQKLDPTVKTALLEWAEKVIA